MAVKVIVPSETYNETFWGVQFVNGVGIFEDEEKARNIAQILGYKVEPIEEPKKETPKKSAPKKATTAKKTPPKKDEA